GVIGVITQAGCAWTASAGDSWINITDPGSPSSPTVKYTVSPNTGAARNSSITISGQVLAIAQDASSGACTYSLSQYSQTVDALGGDQTVTVTPSDATCTWTATSNDSWIIISLGASGSRTGH
ncbi:MAG: BACON domain-containing protein, partial [Deltaproteobacteria bacterium]|nr:BACON domain-containing protein [Deltaproteobacteria bacterium]